MCMRYGRNMHNTRKLPLVVNVNAIRMVRMDYMKIELDLYKHMYELSSQTNVLDT